MLKKTIILFIAILSFFAGFSQEKFNLNVITTSKDDQKVLTKFHLKKTYQTIIDAKKELNNLLFELYKSGYITSTIDTISEDTTSISASLFIGSRYYITNLKLGKEAVKIASDINFKEKFYKNKPANYNEILNIAQKILIECENNGYPFADVKLDSINIDSSKVSAIINLKKNNKINIDSVIVKGTSKITKRYLNSYLSIKPGELYNESDIISISNKINQIPFLSEIKKPEVIFTKDKANVYLYLNKKKASMFNGIIGVVPNDRTTGKLLITGELKLKLLSAFNAGELIDFDWKSISKGTQELNINFAFPYLFSTPFGIDYKFNLFKKDTSYLTLNNNIGILYLFSALTHIKAYAEIQSSSLIKANGLENATVLPPYADISSTLYGIEGFHENLNYRLNPTKGFYIKISGAAGLKKIKRNDKINQVLYDSIQLTTNQFKFGTDDGVFVPLARKHTILFSFKGGYILNQNLFINELYKIGGLKTLRGFDEESIYASLFSILLIEYRFLFERNSYFNIFFNGAYYEKSMHNSFMCDSPYGFGVGVNFETKVGIFSLNYALGSEQGNPILFKNSKIHFGIISYF